MNEVLVYGPIYDFSAQEFVRSFAEITGDSIICRINTNGGNVESAWSMVAKFREFEGNKLVKVDGKAYSMGFGFCLYADNVEALDVSQFMIHRASYGDWYENSGYMTEAELTSLNNVNKALRAAFEAKIDVEKFENLKQCKENGITADKLFSMDSRVDVFLTASDAKKIGLVNRIVKITPEKAAELNKKLVSIAASGDGSGIDDLVIKVPVAETPITESENVKFLIMNRAELQAKHPELFAEIVGLGVARERDRVGAWAVFADVDVKAVKEGIASGEPLSQTAMAEFASKKFSQAKIEAVSKETTADAGATATTEVPVTATPTAASDFQAKLEAELNLTPKKD